LIVNEPGEAVDNACFSAGCDSAGDTGEEGADDVHPPERTTTMMITARSTDLLLCITGQVHTG
jgi:hypothetical protein